MATGRMHTLLVPLDGSELAEQALGPARQIAAARRAAVLLLQVVPHREPREQPSEAAQLEAAHHYLSGVADCLRGQGVTVLVEACAGRPAEQIAEQAEQWRSELIVMSTHGRGGLGRLVHGSTAAAVVRNSSVPVLLVPARCGARPEIAGETILVPVASSALAEAALGPAAELARELAIPVTVLQAVWYASSRVEGLAVSLDRIDRMVAAARLYVDGLATRLRAAGVDARGEVVVAPPVAAIREQADELRAAVVVMATHGRGALGRLALGSVADEVLTATAHPVMLVRADEAAGSTTAAVADSAPKEACA